jgi:23S rRNA pseudouridine1911/1915/1917 synthase
VIGSAEDRWLLEVNPITGRPHQIRVQLSSMGCVISGDVKYGDKHANADGSIYLHARRLSFVHPVKKEPMTFEAPPPDKGMWKYFGNLEMESARE